MFKWLWRLLRWFLEVWDELPPEKRDGIKKDIAKKCADDSEGVRRKYYQEHRARSFED